jgi:polar amino acid transport system substrate-binding protein
MTKTTLSVLGASLLVLAALLCSGSPRAQQPSPTDIAPKGTLRVALIISNPVLVSRTPDGQVSGVAVDIGNALGDKLGLPVRAVLYDNIVRYNQSIGKDEWDIGFAPRDLSRVAQLAFSDPVLEIDNSYVAGAGRMLMTPEDVDHPGIRVGVAQDSATYGYLSRTLRNAQITRLTGGPVLAAQALSSGRIDVYADYTQVAYLIQAQVPGSMVLAQPLNVVRMVIAVPKNSTDALHALNDFIAGAKRDGTITNAIKGAALRGVRAAR